LALRLLEQAAVARDIPIMLPKGLAEKMPALGICDEV
jgi:hypothetical protein